MVDVDVIASFVGVAGDDVISSVAVVMSPDEVVVLCARDVDIIVGPADKYLSDSDCYLLKQIPTHSFNCL